MFDVQGKIEEGEGEEGGGFGGVEEEEGKEERGSMIALTLYDV